MKTKLRLNRDLASLRCLVKLPSTLLPVIAASAISLAPLHAIRAGEVTADTKSFKTPIDEPPEESFIHAFLQLQLSNYYITPRGLIVEDEGLVFQPLFLLLLDLYKWGPDSIVNRIGLTVGTWNSVHSKPSPNEDTNTPYWNEFDFIAGIDMTVLKDFNLSMTYLLFISPVDDYEPPHNLEFKIAYSDHFLEELTPWGKASINPYAKLFVELSNKATVSSTDSSYNFELGLTPSYVFNGYPLSIALPSFITLPGPGFYSEDGIPGVISTGVKVTAPLTFIPKRYGSWAIYGGVQYYHIYNDGIAFGNTLLPSSSTNLNPVQFLGGLTLFF